MQSVIKNRRTQRLRTIPNHTIPYDTIRLGFDYVHLWLKSSTENVTQRAYKSTIDHNHYYSMHFMLASREREVRKQNRITLIVIIIIIAIAFNASVVIQYNNHRSKGINHPTWNCWIKGFFKNDFMLFHG